ncbi:MAG TPA: hypothetical protein VF494_01020 [Candidatus Limnocylindrales bacterium]
MRLVRRLGIAFGSLIAAWLCVWLIGGWLLPDGGSGWLATLVVVILGYLIFRDILRREHAPTDRPR